MKPLSLYKKIYIRHLTKRHPKNTEEGERLKDLIQSKQCYVQSSFTARTKEQIGYVKNNKKASQK